MKTSWRVVVVACLVGVISAHAARAADPPVPSQPHPRLFMSPSNVTQLAALAAKSGTSSSRLVSQCQETIDKPKDFQARNGVDASTWPGAAVACAFAYTVTKQSKYLTQAILYWKTSLNDDQKMGDGLGCTPANANPNVKGWSGNPPAPPGLLTVTHDTGYPIRWYGPFLALTYDWLYDAPGVDEALRTQTRSCLTSWVDNYTLRGYLNDFPGANYNAGYVVAKTMAGVAIGNDGGADGHLWTETLHEIFATLFVSKGLKGSKAAIGAPVGVMVGGDWGSWQYGPLSIIEYAASTRVVEENGAPQPEMDEWINSLVVRQIHGTVPKGDVQFSGNGDFDSESIYEPVRGSQPDAVLLGPSSDQAASWALATKQKAGPSEAGFVWDAFAELRNVQAQDYLATSPPLWYVARGTGTVYARTSWTPSAFWSVFMASPNETDHGHLAASNFVFTRGGDHLVVDSSNYGDYGTFETNGLSADGANMTGDYAHTQTTFSPPGLTWARGTADGVFAARADIAKAFTMRDKSDVAYAHREWAMLPEGEIVTIDRVRTSAATRNMYVNFHTNTKGTLALDASTKIAKGTSGGSQVVIHPVLLSGGTPSIVKPPVGSCTMQCSYPCGSCNAARFAVDEYSLSVPGTWAVAVHVIDGLATGENAAMVASLNDDAVDLAPKHNAGIIGASVFRGMKQSFIVAASAQDGAAGSTMTYAVPGASAARHVVFDAPEAADGTSTVTATVSGSQCVVTVTAGGGGGTVGRPLMFSTAAATNGCTVSGSTDVPAGTPPPGGGTSGGTGGESGLGTGGGPSSGGGTDGTGGDSAAGGSTPRLNAQSISGGCCAISSQQRGSTSTSLIAVAACALAVGRRRPQRGGKTEGPPRRDRK